MHFSLRLLKRLFTILGYGLAGAFIAAVFAYGYSLQLRPDLSPWHKIELDEEFRADRAGEVPDLAAYLRLEDRLFDELDRKIRRREPPTRTITLNRFVAGSLSDPEGYDRNWNRTFELAAENPRATVLLLHGLSDSPYSVRALATTLNLQGAYVLGLRLPGHGTAPVGLADVTWQDFAAAVRLGARYVAGKVPDGQPFYIVGYSNGATLAVEYSLAALADEDLPRPQGLVLLSPAIGITRTAAYAVWQARAAWVTGLEKLAWTDILPEYDPFKYNSFTVNAGEQMYLLIQQITSRINALNPGSGVPGFPPVLAFQSLVDATVQPSALIDVLMRQLPPEGNELVLFDVNRDAAAEPLLRTGKLQLRDDLIADAGLPFALTVITNANEDRPEVVARRKAPFSVETTDTPLSFAWPRGIYSLSHVALPFAPGDALYGYAAPHGPGLHLGNIELRGERGLLSVNANMMTRLRANPFLPYVERRMLDFFGLGSAD